MTDETSTKLPWDFSVPGQPIEPNQKTDGNIFGLIPNGSLLSGAGDAPTLPPADTVNYGVNNGVVVDPQFANTDLFAAESYGDVAVIRPKQDGVYRVDFYCSYRIELASGGSDPFISITNYLHVNNKTFALVYDTFVPTKPTVRGHAVSRCVRLVQNDPVYARFSFTGKDTTFRAWQGMGVDDGIKTGFYLTKL